jgi:hypothetical protein
MYKKNEVHKGVFAGAITKIANNVDSKNVNEKCSSPSFLKAFVFNLP